MKNKITKLLAFMMAIAIVLSLAGCGKDKEKETTTAIGETTTVEETTAQDEATTVEETTAADEATTAVGETVPAGETTTAVAANTIPTTKAEILKAYTDILNQAKKTDKPGFSAIEFQALPKEEQKIGGAVKYLLPIANTFMTDEAKARKEPWVSQKGGDMTGLPVKQSTEGCYITNPAAIKTASCVKLANGNYKITIVLNDETDPEPYAKGQAKAPSNTGGMFQPLGRKAIDNELNNNSTVKNVIKSAEYSLKYYDGTSVLEYNPQNGRIVTLDQKTNTLITMDGTIIILGRSEGTAVLEMNFKFYDFKY